MRENEADTCRKYILPKLTAELYAFLPAVLDRAFKGEL